MKLCLILALGTVLFSLNVCGEECMTFPQLVSSLIKLCGKQRNNKWLWQKMIDCHRPITDEFMRRSAEASCPTLKFVEDPNDTRNTIQDVFLNICGCVEGGLVNITKSWTCLYYGRKGNPYLMSHAEETAAVQKTFGEEVPCNIGKCVLAINLD